MDLNTLMCPVCLIVPEDIEHVLWSSDLATTIWSKVFKLVDIAPPSTDKLRDVYDWFDDLRLPLVRKLALEAILGV
mgnify:CR=1 FL=1